MAEENSGQMALEPLLAAWIKWTMDFWDTMAHMGPGLVGADRCGGQAPGETAVLGDPWQASLNLWQAFFSLLTEAGTVAAVFQGIQAPSKIILRMAQAGWGGYFYLHQQWLEGWQEGGSVSGKTAYENLDQDISRACNEIFEHDFRQLLNLPHLGLTGLSQERVNRATEKFNQFQAAMAEFIHLLYLPVKKSLRAMRGVGGHGRQENPPEDFKDYYKGWLKILEGHYMTLFQSAEFIRTLTHTLHALEDFSTAKEELLSEAMAALGLPTRREMDELYREIYLLKKSVKVLAQKIGRTEPAREEG
jgi:class III poly(R)-hydroxyalkanoic acid synthase PhaE subunit